jgi:hypothetical protein
MTDRYSNGKIYKLVSDFTDKIYIGSTCLPLHKRKYKHSTISNKLSSTKITLLGKFDIILIEEYPCENKNQLLARERYWYDFHKDKCVNERMAFLNEGEAQKNWDAYDKKYKEEHKAQTKEYNKKYNEANKDKIKARNKKYYEDNKEKEKERQLKYRERVTRKTD